MVYSFSIILQRRMSVRIGIINAVLMHKDVVYGKRFV